jgi:hypothetical protein
VGMVTVSGGTRPLASQINTAIDGVTPVVVTTTATVGTIASGFTTNDVRAVTLAGAKLVCLDLYLAVTTAITATSGNITDTTCFTLATAYLPSHAVTFAWDNGSAGGSGVINTDGTVVMRNANATIAVSTNVRISATYIKS